MKIESIQKRGININEERAGDMSKGTGGWGMARFGISVMEGAEMVAIRLVQKEKRIRDKSGRKYTPAPR